MYAPSYEEIRMSELQTPPSAASPMLSTVLKLHVSPIDPHCGTGSVVQLLDLVKVRGFRVRAWFEG